MATDKKFKMVALLLAGIVGVSLCVAFLNPVLEVGGAIPSERPLVIITTDGAEVKHKLVVEERVATDGRLILRFAVSVLEKKSEGSKRVLADYTISVVHPKLKDLDVRCEHGDKIKGWNTTSNLAEPQKWAVDIDQKSKTVSATAYSEVAPSAPSGTPSPTEGSSGQPNAVSGGDDAPSEEEGTSMGVSAYKGQIMSYFLDENPRFSGRHYNDNQVQFIEECSISSSLIRYNEDGLWPTILSRQTYTLPQVNGVNCSKQDYYLTGIESSILIDKRAGFELIEASPQPRENSYSWLYSGEAYSMGEGRGLYSGQQTLVFNNRRLSVEERYIVLYGGTLLGAFVSMSIQAIFELVSGRGRGDSATA